MIYDFVFQVLAAMAVLSAVIMVTRRNPVAAVIFLVAVFFATSGMFVMLDAHYIAAINLILYGGAIMVLFLFVIMLLNLGHADWHDLKGPLGGLVGGAIGVGLLAQLVQFFLSSSRTGATAPAGDALRAAVAEEGVIGLVARPLFSEYGLVLQVTGLLLLTAMVGSILLARKGSA